MKTKNIVLTDTAVVAIEALQHSCGTYRYYTDTLTRLFNLVLAQSDEIGMDDTETVHTLRVLKSLSTDLAYLAGKAQAKPMAGGQEENEEADAASVDTASKVEEAFSGVQDPELSEDDAPRIGNVKADASGITPATDAMVDSPGSGSAREDIHS